MKITAKGYVDRYHIHMYGEEAALAAMRKQLDDQCLKAIKDNVPSGFKDNGVIKEFYIFSVEDYEALIARVKAQVLDDMIKVVVEK